VALDYLRVSLDLTPREYLATSKDYFETALLYQDARRRGIEDARSEHRSGKELEKEEEAALERLKKGL